MKIYALILFVISPIITFAQLPIDGKFPVGRNFATFTSDGVLHFRTIFNKSEISKDTLDNRSVRYTGVVSFLDGRKVSIKGTLNQLDNLTDFDNGITNNDQTYFTKAKEGSWDNIVITVKYTSNNNTFTLPSYIVYSNNTLLQTATKLNINTKGKLLNNNSGVVTIVVEGNSSIKPTKYEILASDGGMSSKPISAEDYTRNGTSLNIKVSLPNNSSNQYRVKVYAQTDGNDLTPVEQQVSFEEQLRITSINGQIFNDNTYGFDLADKKINTYNISTTGSGTLRAECSSKNYQIDVAPLSPGIYQMTVTASKIFLEDEQKLILSANDGSEINGNFKIFRLYPEILILAEQKNTNAVNFSISLSQWVTSDVNLTITKNNATHKLSNSNAKIDKSTNSKIFSIQIPASSFDFDEKKDSVLIGTVGVLLDQKKLLTAQYKFINLNYYKAKIDSAQKLSKSSEKKDAVKNVVTSLFSNTGQSTDSSKFKTIVDNLSSKEGDKQTSGWNSVLSFASKLAPALIALI